MAIGSFAKNNPGALGELQHNQQEPAPRSARKHKDDHGDDKNRARSPTKSGFRLGTDMDTPKVAKSRDASPKKPQKTKSGTNLASFLSRPKSLRNLYKLATDDDIRAAKDKENRTPDETANTALTPIFSQFASPGSRKDSVASGDAQDFFSQVSQGRNCRPVSHQSPWTPPTPSRDQVMHSNRRVQNSAEGQRGRANVGAGFGHTRSKSATSIPYSDPAEPIIDPRDIDKHLEALLDRRNIPENQRYKMRNLNDTIKMEFIRQDWAEMHAAKSDAPDSINSARARGSTAGGSEDENPKRSRGRSFTFARGKKNPTSPTKKQKGEGTLGRHFRSKSSESVTMERPSSSCSNHGSNFLSKIKLQQGPSDYVAYLRKVQKPELVEVGKIHKLRLLLRNETVAWIEDFIQQGGMMEIVGLLNRIMEVEWREEHEDALLHENLLCLKALSTTALAMEYVHSVQADLLPKLLHMLFDPERKGPSEYTTRNIVTSVLLTYIESASPAYREIRAKTVLGHLRDQQPKDEERPLPFVLEMRRDRPYREWCKEVVSVTKEVFWIFLHNVNVVNLPKRNGSDSTSPRFSDDGKGGAYSYMRRHFPAERPPVPAAPYVGGVEWDATNYLASHLDVMNAILACTPTKEERNMLRADMQISGWERCLGGSLRLCKEKFYGSVHSGLRTWVAAAAEDDWDVKDVRFGPPPETRGSPKKMVGGQKKKAEDAPKLDMPKLDFGNEQPRAPKSDAWL